MSYPAIDDPNFAPALLKKKEYYSLKGDPNRNFRNPAVVIPDIFAGKYARPLSHQLFFTNYLSPDTPYKRMQVVHACHPGYTSVIMYNGNLKQCRNIAVGDVLMGDDCTPRRVLRLYTGLDRMYRVRGKVTGDTFTCNGGHILVMRTASGVVVDVPLNKITANMQVVRGGQPKIFMGYTAEERARAYKQKYLARSVGLWRGPLGVVAIPAEGVTVTAKGIDKYFGFELDGNGRYQLKNSIVTHNTGTGKTFLAVGAAHPFANIYRQLYANLAIKLQLGRRSYAELEKSTPNIVVLGFGGTKNAFMRELLKYPDFGFITVEEKDELAKRQKNADSGNADDVKHATDYYTFLRKRITSKHKGGFWKFYGYGEFANKLFTADAGVNLIDIEAQTNEKIRSGVNVGLEEVFAQYIAEGKIRVNTEILDLFRGGSVLICDESHHLYNSNTKNNRGVAVQYVLDTVPGIVYFQLSATPINNSPSESIDAINFLLPPDKKLHKKDFFVNSRTLFPGKLEELGRAADGKWSFFQDVDVRYFPKRIFTGTPVVLPANVATLKAGDNIPYLKFIPCEMSEQHQLAYNRYLAEDTPDANIPADDGETEDESDINSMKKAIPSDGYCIYDMVFPGSKGTAVFRSTEIREQVIAAPSTFKESHGIVTKRHGGGAVISGNFLSRASIGTWSSKYKKLLGLMDDIFLGGPAKVMIYHDRVRLSGGVLIQELLREDGFLDETSEPVDNTWCSVCHKRLRDHAEGGAHQFYPARFIILHSDIEKNARDESMRKFNNPNNVYGKYFNVVIGCRIVKESYGFTAVRHHLIVSLPTNISTMMQVFGRTCRNSSHSMLPISERTVTIYILISTVGKAAPVVDPVSPEMYRYVDKLLDYMTIQKIEREFNRRAVDAPIHRDIIMPPSLKAEYFTESDPEPLATIGSLYFEPALTLPPITLAEIDTTTFTAYGHAEKEIATITFVIKQLFLHDPVWTYDDLWATVRAPPLPLETNPALFDEENFIIALDLLVESTSVDVATDPKAADVAPGLELQARNLFDPAEKFVWKRSRRYKIQHIGDYYILFPMGEPDTDVLGRHGDTDYRSEKVRDHERALVRTLRTPPDRVVADIETHLRTVNIKVGTRANISTFVRERREMLNYGAQRREFIRKRGGIDASDAYADCYEFLTDHSSKFQMAFVEEAIAAFYELVNGKNMPADDKPTLAAVLRLMQAFGVTVSAGEIRKYKETLKQFKSGLPELIGDDVVVGYMWARSVKLYIGGTEDSKWIEISKLSLNRHISYKENEIVVAYLEPGEDYMKLKLRKPVHRIKEILMKDIETRRLSKSLHPQHSTHSKAVTNDTRLIERGMVCSTKNKQELLSLVASLGISMSKLDRTEVRIKTLCGLIKLRLIESEIKERQKGSRYKYLYSWWDEPINLSDRI